MVAAIITVYGPRTTIYVAADGLDGVLEATLCGEQDTTWRVTGCMKEMRDVKLFAPANLRCTQDNEGYERLIQYYMKEKYTLRYTGGMVPDVTQLLVKGGGVFTSPVSKHAPAKLRLLYEALPVAFVIEKAGGRTSDGGASLLRRRVQTCDERTAVCFGSEQEVIRFEQYCGDK